MKPIDKVKAQLVMVTGFLVIGLIFGWQPLVITSAVLGVGFLVSPAFGNFVLSVWFKFAEALGWFNSRVLLSLVYYIILTPIAFAFRLAGNDPLQIKKRPEQSAFTVRNHTITKKDLQNPW